VHVAPWFERWPELAEWELARFAERELPAEVDERARAAGRFVVLSRVMYHGQELPIEVRYPAETPELPPMVYGPPGLLERHDHPFAGNFCLLERPFDDWPARSWGAADLIAERLSALLADSEAGADAVRDAEAPIPEPYSAYYNYPFGAVVLVPGDLAAPVGASGMLRLRQFPGEQLRFLVEAADGTPGDSALLRSIPEGPRLDVPWRRLKTPPSGPNGADVLAFVRREHPDLVRPPLPPKLAGSRWLHEPELQVVALVFREEGPAVGEMRDAWLFLCVPRGGEPLLAHAQIVSTEERLRRAPDLAALAAKRAVIVGLGTLGGDIALELAKAGLGELDLVDFDRYEANNAVRHILGIDFVGWAKTEAVAVACRRINPFTNPRPIQLLVGQAIWNGTSSLEELVPLVEQADVVVETTGSHQLQRLIARVAAEAGARFVSCWLTAGFLGAHVLRTVPGQTRCFVCTATDLAAGRLACAEAGDDALVVAQGCSHPTVAGAGFDAAEAAAVAARLTVQTLLDGAYPAAAWDHAAVSFRRLPDDPDFPRFVAETLPPYEECPQCSSAAGSSGVP
jgi:molybdopterin/thiamine biosynthesis adenylyltransferase